MRLDTEGFSGEWLPPTFISLTETFRGKTQKMSRKFETPGSLVRRPEKDFLSLRNRNLIAAKLVAHHFQNAVIRI